MTTRRDFNVSQINPMQSPFQFKVGGAVRDETDGWCGRIVERDGDKIVAENYDPRVEA